MEKIFTTDTNSAELIRGGASTEALAVHGHYEFECYDKDGNLKWTASSDNIVPNQGKNAMLDTYLAGSAYTAAFYMSLITAGTAISTSTYASPTVTEIGSSIVTSNLRPAISWSSASAGSKSATTTAFTIVGTATITGNMVVSGGSGITTVGNTAASGGVLFSASAFSGAVTKNVSNGDTLNVTYSVSV